MTLDQRLTDAARQIAGGLLPPEVDLDAVRAQARSNRRRTAALAVAAAVTAVIAVATAFDGRAVSAPPPTPATTPSPSQESSRDWSPALMTPKVVVNSPTAELEVVGVAPGDTDIRLSVWGVAGYRGMALTTDGYRSTTYASVPDEANQVVSSPKDGVFLLSNGSDKEWLVDVQGTVRRVKRVMGTGFVPTDSRLWFQCANDSWRSDWCALDLNTATAHVSAKKWNGSAVRPGLGVEPWGANPEPRAASTTGRLEAWWYTARGRQVHTLATVRDGDYISATPPGEMAFWAPGARNGTLDIHTSRNGGADWNVQTHAAPDLDLYSGITRSPDGALLTCAISASLVVMRAEASGGPFRAVYQMPSFESASGTAIGTQGDLVYLIGGDAAAVSQDGGRTWTTVRTWR
jgi:hypothetical protein